MMLMIMLARILLTMSKMNVDSPNEIRAQTFYAFSYYFDRAVEVGLITEKGGEVTEKLNVIKFKKELAN